MAELGVCYYPEQWPEVMWAEDARQMRELGINWVRISEFAWSRIEPEFDQFNWEWLDSAIETLAGEGLKIILCTPTATPPRWMLDRHPDMLAADENGHHRKFGSRRHYCFSHDGYRQECSRITEILAQRYADHPAIKAWQLDNEYGCHDTVISYSDASRAAFRIWLQDTYGNIAELNRAWGNVFWSMEYNKFDQIDLPNETVTEPNPAHAMDFRRFSSDQVVQFNRVQADVLRRYTQVPLIHNYMGRITEFDHFSVGDDLDIASWDSYPLGFLEDRSDQSEGFKRDYMRQGDPDFQAFHHDLYRAVGRGRWWVMEQQAGPVNWAPYNPKPLAGMVRLWSWEAFFHGAEVVSYFRWRQVPFAQEQMHSGLQCPNGNWTSESHDVRKVAQELRALLRHKTKSASVGLVFDYSSAWAWDVQPQGESFDYFRLVYDFYKGLRKCGLSVDIIGSAASDFGDKKVVFIPGLFALTDTLRAAMDKFEGQVVCGPRTGSKTKDFQIPRNLPPDFEGFDCKVMAVESLRQDCTVPLKKEGAFVHWREFLETNENVIANTLDEQPAIIKKDKLTYIAGWPDEEFLQRFIMENAENWGVALETLPYGVRRRDWEHLRCYMNYTKHAVQLDIGHKSFNIEPADILLINEKNEQVVIDQ